MQPTNYDSDFCGSLPIHLTNLIQPYGVLLVLEHKSFRIMQASENCSPIFGRGVAELLNTRIADYLPGENVSQLNEKLTSATHSTIPAVWEINGKHLLVLVHPKPDFIIVEIDLEPMSFQKEDSFVKVYQELKYAMTAIEGASTLEETCARAASELKKISGFDKVMIYQFDSEWNGTVIAEERESDMEEYLSFTFPASDIPKQARELYLKNPYRFIPDRTYKPVKLYPVLNPATNSFIDLSDCNLRSVATVHIEYLKNMGVMASMSTRILHHDKLWGLIACHHKAAKPMSYEMCSAFEMLSSIISVKITSLQNEGSSALKNRISSSYAGMVESIYKSGTLDQTILEDEILNLFSATGAVISRNGRFRSVGDTPAPDELEELLLWLHTRGLKRVYSTDHLGREYDRASEFEERGSGMLVIPINHFKDEYLIIFRREQVRVINWGGDPEERIQFEKDERTYHPRNSFEQWQQTVRGSSLPWKKEELDIAETLRSFIYEYETSVIS